ncbi:MAG: DCC1-like thiol-disulfide oxidoreductase family protein [Hyphomicrobium sp.]|jgi:predicted DCC family thiol-disulfide oxidoreductase YuxK
MPHAPHSYRNDPAVPRFDDSRPLIIFDGKCVLCSEGVQWLLARDPDGTTHFAAVQEAIPQAIYRHYGLDAERYDTFMVLRDGRPYTKWAATCAAARTMPAPWRWLGHVGRIIPDVLGNRLYDWIQRNRIRWFGARETCFRGEARHAARFLS